MMKGSILGLASVVVSTAVWNGMSVQGTTAATEIGPPRAEDVDGWLSATKSDRDLERKMGGYFEEVLDWKISYNVFPSDPDDLYLTLNFLLSEGTPVIRHVVDAIPIVSSADGGLIATRIKIQSTFSYGLAKGHARRAQALEALNAFEESYWVPQRVYLKDNGNLCLESSVNVPADAPVAIASIVHWIRSTNAAWEILHEALEKEGFAETE